MTLAILGGEPTITVPHPHNPLTAVSPADSDAIIRYLRAADADFEDMTVLRELEEMLASFHGRRYCLLTNSGTSALHSAYFGLGLRPGDEVIAPTHTFPATVTALFSAGATPVLADCEVDTGNIDPGDVAAKITKRTKAVVVTHQWGHPVEMDALLRTARRHGLRVIEDASLAVGATYRGRRTGSFGDAAALSLSASKLIGGGVGGALLTNDRDVIDRALLLGQFSRSGNDLHLDGYRPYATTGYGHNYRIHVLAAVVAKARLERINDLIARRHARLGLLSELLREQDVVSPPVTRPYVHRGQWGGYIALYEPDRAKGVSLATFGRALVAEGLEVSPGGYHPLLHRTAVFSQPPSEYQASLHAAPLRRYREGDFPQAEHHADRQIGMPTFLGEPDELIEGYARAFVKVAHAIDELRQVTAVEGPAPSA
jgi:dTDP-4-amino-4,6-dideoxygalactose transaminase